MRVLVSTFSDGDDDKVLLAMRNLRYDRLVLVGFTDEPNNSLNRLRRLEGLSGQDVDFREIEPGPFMEMVNSISNELSSLADKTSSNEVVLNISGGSKILGDAALLAAFRLGMEAYHCDKVVTKLPVLKGATAKDRFTALQVRLIDVLADGESPFDDVVREMQPNSKPSAERTIRELKKMQLLVARPMGGKVFLGLSPEGAEVARATRFARGL